MYGRENETKNTKKSTKNKDENWKNMENKNKKIFESMTKTLRE